VLRRLLTLLLRLVPARRVFLAPTLRLLAGALGLLLLAHLLLMRGLAPLFLVPPLDRLALHVFAENILNVQNLEL